MRAAVKATAAIGPRTSPQARFLLALLIPFSPAAAQSNPSPSFKMPSTYPLVALHHRAMSAIDAPLSIASSLRVAAFQAILPNCAIGATSAAAVGIPATSKAIR